MSDHRLCLLNHKILNIVVGDRFYTGDVNCVNKFTKNIIGDLGDGKAAVDYLTKLSNEIELYSLIHIKEIEKIQAARNKILNVLMRVNNELSERNSHFDEFDRNLFLLNHKILNIVVDDSFYTGDVGCVKLFTKKIADCLKAEDETKLALDLLVNLSNEVQLYASVDFHDGEKIEASRKKILNILMRVNDELSPKVNRFDNSK